MTTEAHHTKPTVPTEHHPLQPFLPAHARVLMLGSFPPQQKRWCMDFITRTSQRHVAYQGFLFYHDAGHFVSPEAKCFRKEDIIAFLNEKGIALYDTATAVRRLQDNASDKFLEVVIPTDIPSLLKRIPLCTSVVTTGQKATDTLCETFHIQQPAIGCFTPFTSDGRYIAPLPHWPSSSRAYPDEIREKWRNITAAGDRAGLVVTLSIHVKRMQKRTPVSNQTHTGEQSIAHR